MANEIRATYDTGETLYALVFRADGDVWDQTLDGANGDWTPFDNANLGNYDIVLTEIDDDTDDSGQYRGTFPPNITAGVYSVCCYLQAGGGPVWADDEYIGSPGVMNWDGSAEITLNTMDTVLDTIAGDVVNIDGITPEAAGVAATPADVATALTDINLDHLMFQPVADRDIMAEVVDDTVLANIMTKTDGDTSDFDHATDSLEAMRDEITAVSDSLEVASGETINDGTAQGATDFNDTHTDNGTHFDIKNVQPGDTGIDVEVLFAIGTSRIGTQLHINGYFNAVGSNKVEIYAYNYTSSSFDKLSTGSIHTEMRDRGSDKDYDFALSTAYTDPATGNMRIRFLADANTADDELFLDYIVVTAAYKGSAISSETISNAVWGSGEGHDVSRHTVRYVGHIWYVDRTNGDDTNSGITVHEAFQSIPAAIAAASAGDKIEVSTGTYTEAVVLNKTGLELIGEYGVIIDAAAANCVTINANDCKVTDIFATPNNGYWGFVFAAVHRGFLVNCESYAGGDGGFQVASGANRVLMKNCKARGYDASGAGFEIDGQSDILENCTAMTTVAAALGYNIKSHADRTVLKDCVSINNAGASFQIDAGATDTMMFSCADSEGCGAMTDAGTDTSIRNFHKTDAINNIETDAAAILGDTDTMEADLKSYILTDVIGADSDTLETLSDQLDVLGAGSGGTEETYIVTDSSTGLPIDGVHVWVSSDLGGANIIWAGYTNAAGQVKYYHDLAAGTPVYLWRELAGYTFDNPDAEVTS